MMVLVTGASGYVGSALVANLVRRDGMRIRAATRNPNAVFPKGVERVIIAPGSERLDWGVALRGVDVIVHLAARAHVMREERGVDPLKEFIGVNVGLTGSLADAASREGVRRLVFVSSIGVNGAETHGRPFVASDRPFPVTPYAHSKLEAEQMLKDWQKRTSVELVVVRPPLVIGPKAPGNLKLLVRLLSAGVPLPLASLNNKRSFVGIDNLIDFLGVCLTHPLAAGQTFLVSDARSVSTPELLRLMAGAMGLEIRLFPFPVALLRLIFKALGREETFRSLCCSLEVDMRPTLHALDWTPSVSLEETIRRACQ